MGAVIVATAEGRLLERRAHGGGRPGSGGSWGHGGSSGSHSGGSRPQPPVDPNPGNIINTLPPEPVDPSAATKPAKPAKPVNPVKPVKPVKPDNSAKATTAPPTISPETSFLDLCNDRCDIQCANWGRMKRWCMKPCREPCEMLDLWIKVDPLF